MKQEVLVKVLSPAELHKMKRLTVKNIGLNLMNIFADHIGGSEAINKSKLFKLLFGHFDSGGLADELRWVYAKKGMHFLRQRTKCFIASECRGNKWFYFVIKTKGDARAYIDVLENNIKRMRTMQRKAVRAADENWHKIDWKADAVSKKLLK